MLGMNGVDDSDYESSDAGSYDYDGEEDEDAVGDEPERVVEEDDRSIEGSDDDEDAFDANDPDADPAEFEDDEAFARALQDAEEREVAVRLMALTGLNEFCFFLGASDDHEDHGSNSQVNCQNLLLGTVGFITLINLALDASYFPSQDTWQEVDPDEYSYEVCPVCNAEVSTSER
ncbi:hypothetical protein BHE74_00058934 [Ensete ventricosum]|nr:hypothetical protein BHE74_00058934 [Ensete ventricosum]